VDVVLDTERDAWANVLRRIRTHRLRLIAPPLLWSESASVLHELVWRGFSDPESGRAGLSFVESAPVLRVSPPELLRKAWEIAERMGWARTYDAEYCALAELERCDLVTTDRRLRASARRLGYVVGPSELAAKLE
jgi:predicted nucleic acid-binding protein